MNEFEITREVRKYAEQKINELLKKYHWDFIFDNAKRRFGYCSFEKQYISLSRPLVLLNWEKNREQVINTILHEIAHAIAWERYGWLGANHGWRWKNVCIEIGCKPERCYEATEVETPKGKYKYVCSHCGREVFYHKRRCKETACGVCCRKYNRGYFSKEYLLILSE